MSILIKDGKPEKLEVGRATCAVCGSLYQVTPYHSYPPDDRSAVWCKMCHDNVLMKERRESVEHYEFDFLARGGG